jgi:putative peptidoglycan lipid II flippase
MVTAAKRLLSRANRQQSVGHAAILISLAFLLSSLLGLFRQRLLVAHFGIGPELSAYYAAFRLPDLLFTLLVTGGFAVSFIPVFNQYMEKDKQEEAWRVTATLLNLMVIGTLLGGVLLIIFASPLTTLITPGFDPHTHALATNITRIMAITPMLFAVSSVLGSVQQAFNRFVFFSLAGTIYNLGIIFGIVFFTGHLGVYGAAWGVVLGVAAQALAQWLGLYGLGFKYRPVLMVRLAGVGRILRLMIPRSIDQGIDQINYSVETVIGSTISTGAIGQFALANNLKNLPLILIGTSISTAVFPKLAARAAAGQMEQLIEGYVKTARLILFLAIPSALFAVVARGYIVRLLYGFGDAATANTLGWFAGTIIFTSFFMLVSRVFFAMQDTKTPLYTSIASIPLNIGLSIILAKYYGVSGLAMAASIVAVFETLLLVVILHRRHRNFGEITILKAAIPMALAGLIMASVVYVLINRVVPLYATDKGFLVLLPKFLFITVVAVITYMLPCMFLRLGEAHEVVGRLRDLMARATSLT